MPASVRVRVTHLLLRVLSRARECSLARSAFWHASVSRVSRERLARFVTFLVSGTVQHKMCEETNVGTYVHSTNGGCFSGGIPFVQ